jgi:RimJ/RimL family protein N-acetyltransferase
MENKKMFTVIPFENKYEQEWDRFIADDAINGTFLQSRNFLNYHPKDRFIDSSCLVFKENKLVAVIPGCVINEDGKKVFSSHSGSTFGGPVIHKKYYNAFNLIEIMKTLENYLSAHGFQKSAFKITSDLFCKEKSDLLQYVLTYCGYNSYFELSTYIDFENYGQEIQTNFSHGQKENLKYALKKEMYFKRLESDKDVDDFYIILAKNLLKFDAKPVHTIEELIDFKNNRLKDIVDFFGIFYGDKIIAGTMLFKINQIVHTQYLAADAEYSELRPMTYLYYNLINWVKNNGYNKLSWGISTERQGIILNESLLAFKESFGSKYALNRVFHKMFQIEKLQFDEFTNEYLEKSWEWLNDPEIRQLTDTPIFTKEEQFVWYLSLPERTDYRIWGISISGIKIGIVELKKIENGQAEFFTYIGDKSYWGKGLGVQILLFAEKYAREHLKIKLLKLKVLNTNLRAMKLFQRYGFSFESKDASYNYMIMLLPPPPHEIYYLILCIDKKALYYLSKRRFYGASAC